jgi:hypothetical protein
LKLDYDKIIKQADKLKISSASIIKRKLNYRKSLNTKCCGKCENKKKVNYKDREAIQCKIIGEYNNINHDVELNYICLNYKYGGII